MKDTLWSMGALAYCVTRCRELENLMISKDQWAQLAQFEAILRPAMRLCFDMQGDRI